MVTFDDFAKLDIRVGKIVEVTTHPNADKLYLLKVDIGEKVVQLVAGIRPYYTAEDLKDKCGIIIINLEPREIRGCMSEGMLLAAQGSSTTSILIPLNAVEPGSKIR
ncbi:MAG: hypothetical protein WCI77_04255 [Candidatus Omnitrophota bacterium]